MAAFGRQQAAFADETASFFMDVNRRQVTDNALINAIYDATGHRFRSLPVTQAMIKGVLK